MPWEESLIAGGDGQVDTLGSVEILNAARHALAGSTKGGTKIHASMFDRDVVSFAHGEGVRRPHPSVVAEGVKALLDHQRSSLDNYLFLQRCDPLEDAIALKCQGLQISGSNALNVCVDAGTTRVFQAFLNTATSAGDTILTSPGYYHPLSDWCHRLRLNLVCVQTERDNSFKLCGKSLERAIDKLRSVGLSRPRALILFNPNLSGAIYNENDLKLLEEVLVGNDMLIVEDLIFSGTEFPGTAPVRSICQFGTLQDRVVSVMGCSKAHGLANIRIGWACGPRNIIQPMNRFVASTSATIPQLAKLMALAALQCPAEYLQTNAVECYNRFRMICRLIKAIDGKLCRELKREVTSCIKIPFIPYAGHSCLIEFPVFNRETTELANNIELARALLRIGRIAFSPGLSIGYDGFTLKATFGCVGAEHTYQHSRREEILWLKRKAGDIVSRQKAKKGFRAGRKTIRLSFKERLYPALRSMLCSTGDSGGLVQKCGIGMATLVASYRYFLIDVWGVIFDGKKAFPDAIHCLEKLKSAGGSIALLSNTSRSEVNLRLLLANAGITSSHYDAVVTSGEIARAYIGNNFEIGATYYRLGEQEGMDWLDTIGARPCDSISEADFLLAGGTVLPESPLILRDSLKVSAARRIPLVCSNPDRSVVIGKDVHLCSGMLADMYESLGGRVIWCGKPEKYIYNECLDKLGATRKYALCVGDGLQTDIAGASQLGIDGLWISEKQAVSLADREELDLSFASHDAFPKYLSSSLFW
jgi:aspartate aminotransferase